jgi:hypothetical protein
MKKHDKVMSKAPQYIVKAPKFQCPISPYIDWHKDLKFIDCPVGRSQRDMGICDRCPLQGEKVAKNKAAGSKPKRRKKKEDVPVINKTYVSKE